MLEVLINDATFLKSLYDKVLKSSFSLFADRDSLCMENYLHYGVKCCDAMLNITSILNDDILKNVHNKDNLRGLQYLASWRSNMELFHDKCNKTTKLGMEVACMHAELIYLSKQMEEELRRIYTTNSSSVYTLPHRRVSQLKNGIKPEKKYKSRKKLPSSTLRRISTQMV